MPTMQHAAVLCIDQRVVAGAVEFVLDLLTQERQRSCRLDDVLDLEGLAFKDDRIGVAKRSCTAWMCLYWTVFGNRQALV